MNEGVPMNVLDPADPYLSFGSFNLESVRSDLEKRGFSIVRKLIPEKHIPAMREFWIPRFGQGSTGRVTWAPYFGQTNQVGFSADAFQNLFRACDFLWNEPMHIETREIGVRLNALRNVLLGKDQSYGLRLTDNRYGIFMTASYYPATTGSMGPHEDGLATDQMLLHCLAPCTFKGVDYAQGGMTIVDRDGKLEDVESQLQPGDVVFYDGALRHGVSPIVPLPGKSIGRLQISPLPTTFSDIATNPRALNGIPWSTYVRAKWDCFKNSVRVRLGMHPGMR
jgi:hypothetical protein